MNRKYFGTDGVRGVANIAPMDAETALAIGRATAYVLKRNHKGLNRILVGKDTRLSGYMLESALTAGICSMGVDVLLTGPVPTPAIAFLTRTMRCAAGIVISASHNPFEDNGIKIFNAGGFKLPDAQEEEIESLLDNPAELLANLPPPREIGRAKRISDARGRYVEFCKSTFPAEFTLEGMKIVIDCSNGAAYGCAPDVFRELGAEVETLHAKPDGMNINERCGSQHTEDLRARVVASGATIGLAFDGDADRLITVDEKGREVSGDHTIAICAQSMLAAGTLRNRLVVLTPMSNLGLRLALDKMGVSWVDAGVGDRLVLARMQKDGAVLGGEQSGHVIFLDKHTTGDGIVSALQIIAAMKRSGKPLSELASIFTEAPQRLVNVEVREKPPVESLPGVAAAIAAAEKELGRSGRVLVRYSGTQKLCRVMVEAASEEAVERICSAIAAEVRAAIGAA